MNATVVFDRSGVAPRHRVVLEGAAPRRPLLRSLREWAKPMATLNASPCEAEPTQKWNRSKRRERRLGTRISGILFNFRRKQPRLPPGRHGRIWLPPPRSWGNGTRLGAEHQPQRHFTASAHSSALRLVLRTQPRSGGRKMRPAVIPLAATDGFA